LLIAIDGPAGAGKSTVARALARKLGFTYLDSGAMYRCVALAAIERGGAAPLHDVEQLARLAGELHIELIGDQQDTRPRVSLNGRDVTEAIRAAEVSEAASQVAAVPGVREAMVSSQRELIAAGDWVAEGRDIGTVVAPEAELKVFLTADAEERARRRASELRADPQRVLAEQTLRDERDSLREHSPLTPAKDAVVLDTTALTLEQVIERIAGLARSDPPSGTAS